MHKSFRFGGSCGRYEPEGVEVPTAHSSERLNRESGIGTSSVVNPAANPAEAGIFYFILVAQYWRIMFFVASGSGM